MRQAIFHSVPAFGDDAMLRGSARGLPIRWANAIFSNSLSVMVVSFVAERKVIFTISASMCGSAFVLMLMLVGWGGQARQPARR